MATVYDGSARPRVKVKGDTSVLNGGQPSAKVLGIVAELPFLEQHEPVTVTSEQAMRQLNSIDYNMQLLTHLTFNAANDPKISGRPQSIVLVNVQPNTQASLTLNDSDASGSMVVKSLKWGAVGNQSTITAEGGSTAGLKLTATGPWATTETYDDVGGEDVVSFRYTGSDATEMTMTFDTSAGLRISYLKSGIPVTSTFATPDFPFDGIITVTPSASWTGTVTISGTNKDTSAAETEVLSWTGSAAETPSTKKWSAVTSLAFSGTGPTLTIEGYSFDLDVATYDKASKLVDKVGAHASFTATNEAPRASTRDTTKLDALQSKWLAYDAGTSAFSAGDVVTGGSSGARGVVVDVQGVTAEGAVQMVNVLGEFDDGEDLNVDGSKHAVANGTLGDWFTAFDNGSSTYAVGETITGGASSAESTIVGLQDDTADGFFVSVAVSGDGYEDGEAITSGSASKTGATADGDTYVDIPVDGVTVPIHDTLHSAVEALAGSAIFSAEAASGASLPPNHLAKTPLTAGAQTTTGAADWTDALQAMRSYDVDVFWLGTDNSTQHAALKSHAEYMAGDGGYACDGIVGAAASESEAALFTRTKALGTRHVSLVFQSIDRADQEGVTQTLAPKYLALQAAAMRCSVNYGVPLTRRSPVVTKVTQNSNIDPDASASALIQKGLFFLTTYRGGLRFERSVTTNLSTSDRVATEQSTNESFNASNNDMREYIDDTIGDPGVATLNSRIEQIAQDRLIVQLGAGIISGFVGSTINVENLGTYRRVNYTIGLVEPNNFVELRPTAGVEV